MNNIKSTVGVVGSDGVMLKDETIFQKGELVVVISAKNLETLFEELNTVNDNLKKSKEWIKEIEKMKE
ncbi:hypothetical protein [Methanobacterium sp. ACI-7]|uniref:hypothetical protein n=1 Tax=Methanobacterium sp. ACI-7 TaxID=3240853 RepID=UPI0039C08F1D